MKTVVKIFCFIILFILLANAKIFSQTEVFEGKVKVKLINEGETHFMDYLVKGNKFRMEIQAEESEGKTTMIMDMKEMKMITLMPEQKMYMEYPLKQTMEKHEAEIKEEMGKVTVTNETKEINGFSCTKIIYNEEKNVEAWVTKDIGNFMFFENPMGGDMPEWYSEFSNAGFFPILVTERDEDGEEESRWEVTSVEKKSLSEDLFVPPAGYEKMEIPMMDFLK